MSGRYRFADQGRTRGEFLEHLKFYETFSRQVKENCLGRAQARQVERLLSGVAGSLSRAWSRR